MADDAARRAWVTRVLGVEFAAAAAPPVKAMSVWQSAKDAADDQLRALADFLRKAGVPALGKLSDDIERLTDQLRVSLVTALMEYDRAGGTPPSREAALKAVTAASAWLGTDPRVKAVDTNQFGIKVTIATTLGAALRQLQRDLAMTAGAAA